MVALTLIGGVVVCFFVAYGIAAYVKNTTTQTTTKRKK